MNIDFLSNFEIFIGLSYVEFVFTHDLRSMKLLRIIIVQRSLLYELYNRYHNLCSILHWAAYWHQVDVINCLVRYAQICRTLTDSLSGIGRFWMSFNEFIPLCHEVVVKKFLSDGYKSHEYDVISKCRKVFNLEWDER